MLVSNDKRGLSGIRTNEGSRRVFPVCPARMGQLIAAIFANLRQSGVGVRECDGTHAINLRHSKMERPDEKHKTTASAKNLDPLKLTGDPSSFPAQPLVCVGVEQLPKWVTRQIWEE